MDLQQQLRHALEQYDFATFDNLVDHLDIGRAGKIAKTAYEVGHIEGLKRIVQLHPQRDYALALQYIISQNDSAVGLWLLEHSSKTTIGLWDITNYGDLRNQVNEELYTALIERQVQYLEPRFIMASALHHKREDFAQTAIRKMERFPLYPDRKPDVHEMGFIHQMLGLKSVALAEDFMAFFPAGSVLHAMIGEICGSYKPEGFKPILVEVMERYNPTKEQIAEVNSWIHSLLEYDEMEIVRCLMPYYDPHYNKGEIFITSMYMDDQTDFMLFLDATPLDVQKNTLKHVTQRTSGYAPPHLALLQSRIADLEVREKLHDEVGGVAANSKIRLM